MANNLGRVSLPLPDYYRSLQVDSSAEWEVIEAAYRRLARKYHPDIYKEQDANERMKQLNIAYEVLRDEGKRRDYDEQRARQTASTASSTSAREQPKTNPPSNGTTSSARPGPNASSSYGRTANQSWHSKTPPPSDTSRSSSGSFHVRKGESKGPLLKTQKELALFIVGLLAALMVLGVAAIVLGR